MPRSRPGAAEWLLFGIAFLIGAGVAVLAIHAGAGALSGRARPRIVTLDAVKLVNAERAAVSGMLGKGTPHEDIALRMLRIGHEVRKTIRREAGQGTIVLVKQAVVAGDLPDITDRVLELLGLPTKVPTVDVAKYLDRAPTTADLAQYGLWLRRRDARILAEGRRQERARKRQAGRKAAERALP